MRPSIVMKCTNRNEIIYWNIWVAQVTVRRLRGLSKALTINNPLAEQFIPISLLGASGFKRPQMQKRIFKSDKIKDLVHEMASHAHSTYPWSPDPSNGLFIKLSAYGCQRYLAELQKQNFDVCSTKVEKIGSQKDGFLPIKLFFKSLFNKQTSRLKPRTKLNTKMVRFSSNLKRPKVVAKQSGPLISKEAPVIPHFQNQKFHKFAVQQITKLSTITHDPYRRARIPSSITVHEIGLSTGQAVKKLIEEIDQFFKLNHWKN